MPQSFNLLYGTEPSLCEIIFYFFFKFEKDIENFLNEMNLSRISVAKIILTLIF